MFTIWKFWTRGDVPGKKQKNWNRNISLRFCYFQLGGWGLGGSQWDIFELRPVVFIDFQSMFEEKLWKLIVFSFTLKGKYWKSMGAHWFQIASSSNTVKVCFFSWIFSQFCLSRLSQFSKSCYVLGQKHRNPMPFANFLSGGVVVNKEKVAAKMTAIKYIGICT